MPSNGESLCEEEDEDEDETYEKIFFTVQVRTSN